jgi:pimeloyl-ACP methyl ester carboxylesterase
MTAAALAAGLVAWGPVTPATGQTLAWGQCSNSTLAVAGFQCARLRVPVDSANPGGGEFSLALTRHASTGRAAERIGALIFIPGGAFGSGLDAAPWEWPALSANIQRHFDFVSWDPRGFGATTPALAACTVAPFRPPAVGPVDWNAAVDAYRPIVAAANTDCYARNNALAGHITTADVARDLESIRVALGETTLTIYGASHGTKVGYEYATAHPDHVRALVLDSSVDPTGSIAGLATSALAADDAWRVFTAARPHAARQFAASLAALGQRPLQLTNTQTFTRWDLLDAVGLTANEEGYDQLAAQIGYVHLALTGPPDKRRAAARVLLRDWTPASEGWAAGLASLVECSDFSDRPGPAEQAVLLDQAHAVAPLQGQYAQAQLGMTCEGVPEPTTPPSRAPDPSTLHVLLIGTTHDAATPYLLTTRMRGHFPISRVVTYDSTQHVSWTGRSACVNQIADRYLLSLRLPTTDVRCPSTHP